MTNAYYRPTRLLLGSTVKPVDEFSWNMHSDVIVIAVIADMDDIENARRNHAHIAYIACCWEAYIRCA
jgi:hypothetical protein